jgi:hypothetical protein
MGRVPPKTDPHDGVRFKPPVIPLLFLWRLEMRGVHVHTQFAQPAAKEISLGC